AGTASRPRRLAERGRGRVPPRDRAASARTSRRVRREDVAQALMASIVSHFLVGAGMFRFVDAGRATKKAGPSLAGCLAMLPDFDSLLMPWFPYESRWGHRGMTHS